jgi:hypothetical protein
MGILDNCPASRRGIKMLQKMISHNAYLSGRLNFVNTVTEFYWFACFSAAE